jgi:hypothetical protein
MTIDGTCERGGFQRAPQEFEKIPPVGLDLNLDLDFEVQLGIGLGLLGPKTGLW